MKNLKKSTETQQTYDSDGNPVGAKVIERCYVYDRRSLHSLIWIWAGFVIALGLVLLSQQ